MKYYLFPLLLALPLNQALADNDIPSNAVQPVLPTPEINPEKPIQAPTMSPEASELQSKVKNAESALEGVTLEDLKKNPALAEKALNLGMLRENWGLVEAVLPIYKEDPKADPLLIDYAQGAIYREKGEYKKAINLYRKLIAENPDKLRVRMDLAMLLFADHQDTAAKDQFTKLRSDPGSDDLVKQLIDQYLESINQRASWSFNAGLSYIQDDNVNNASKSKVIRLANNLVFQKEKGSLPQSAHGIDFSLGVARDFNLVGSHYLSLDASGYGKVYWDNHPFDDLGARLGIGYKYKDARNNFGFTPFAKYRHFGDDPYSKTFGFSINASRWLSPNWQISTYNELAFEKNLQEANKDRPSERQIFTSANVLFAPKATQYFILNGSIFDVKAQTKTASSTRYGISATWNQDWNWGISSRLNLGTGYKGYKGESYFGKTRKDQDFSAGLTLWNRDWHAWGITPKLSFKYNKVDSNIDDLYSYDKGTVFLQFDKTF